MTRGTKGDLRPASDAKARWPALIELVGLAVWILVLLRLISFFEAAALGQVLPPVRRSGSDPFTDRQE